MWLVQRSLVDSVRFIIESEDHYLQEVTTGKRNDAGTEHIMLKMSEKELETHKLVFKDGALFHNDLHNPKNPTQIASTVGPRPKGQG